ncbi:uncharacterized protein LOC128553528 [Mercenaria mercenaria]|uniref:uncharacterized protein LOC128553528 n=1 Tax=Mercenaria mercenaria TaxID=6596 RepID=UPI00234F8929|nr:uncharacterized protein LOC128553528 [Mercenaria mercenaria]
MKQSGLFLFFTLFGIVSCSHFRGAIFTWAPGSDGTYIIVTFRISWRIGRAFCNDTMIADGTLISGEGTMTCFSGCTGNVGSLKFYCTDYKAEEWSFGRNSVIYVPPSSVKQFSFGFSGGNWIALLQGGGSWSLRATVDLSMRSDNGKINTSPTVEMPPVVNWQTGCSYNLTLPVADVDGDVVKCRWAKETEECGGVCQTFPGSKLDQVCFSRTILLTYTRWF